MWPAAAGPEEAAVAVVAGAVVVAVEAGRPVHWAGVWWREADLRWAPY